MWMNGICPMSVMSEVYHIDFVDGAGDAEATMDGPYL